MTPDWSLFQRQHAGSTPPPVASDAPRGFPVPTALARLSSDSIAAPEAEDTLNARYGETPGRTSISQLGADLGVGIRIIQEGLDQQPSAVYPLVALLRTGGALIVHHLKDNTATIEGADGRQEIAVTELRKHLSGTLLVTGEATNTLDDGAASDERSWINHLNGDQDLLAWMGSILWRHHRGPALQLLLAAGLSNLFLLALPIFIMSVYDRVIPHTAFETLQALIIGIGIVLIADAGLRFARLKFVDALGISLGRRLQHHIYQRLLHTPLAKRPKSAASVQTVHAELEGLSLLVPEVGVGILADGAFAIGVLLIIASIGGPVVIAPVVGMALSCGIILWAARSARGYTAQSVALRGAQNTQVAETVDALATIKATGSQRQLMDRFEQLSARTAAHAHAARHRLRYATNSVQVIVQATIVVTVLLAVFRINAGAMSIGSMAAITILVGRAVSPVGQLIDQISRLHSMRMVVKTALTEFPNEEAPGRDHRQRNAGTIKGRFQLSGVSYQPDGAPSPTLDNITLTIEPGERVGIIGRNGSGKSTLLQTLPLLLEPTAGALRVDDHDARQYGAATLQRLVGFMPQETVLFHRSIYDNICLGAPPIDAETFETAMQQAGVDRFVNAHPEGYSFVVGPRGEYLSAGERQAIGLGRTLLQRPRALVLDEPTSLMDQSAEAHVINTLKNLTRDTTLIVSTHRLRLLDAVDRVILLDDGRILADGPKAEVMANMGRRDAA